jgi:hypothetical protein
MRRVWTTAGILPIVAIVAMITAASAGAQTSAKTAKASKSAAEKADPRQIQTTGTPGAESSVQTSPTEMTDTSTTSTRKEEPSTGGFNLERESRKEHEAIQIDRMGDEVVNIRKRLDRLELITVFVALLALVALVLSALSWTKSWRIARDLRRFSRRARGDDAPQFERSQFIEQPVSRQPSNDMTFARLEDDDWTKSSWNDGLRDKKEQEEVPEPRQQEVSRRSPKHESLVPPHSKRHHTTIDEPLVLQLGAACLDFPRSVDGFRSLWNERGGDGSVDIEGYPTGNDDHPSVILVGSRDGSFLAVPNTTDWDRLSKTGFFDPDGPVAPGSRVIDVIALSRGKIRGSKPHFEQKGRVRVDV